MSQSPNLNLPYILAAQSQKHVTHNEAIRALDALVQLSVLDRDLTAPPGAPADGDRYIVASGATGEWSGQAGRIAAFQDGAWAYFTPLEGWRAWVNDEAALLVFDGSGWTVLSTGGGGVSDHGALTGLNDDDHPQYHNDARGDARYTPVNPSQLGINGTADGTNRLTVASTATLLNHAGNGHQVKVNKNVMGDTASFLFQTGFSGRAEIGTIGDDSFHFKVSSDGTGWHDAIQIDRDTGQVGVLGAPQAELHVNTNAVEPTIQVTNSGGIGGAAFRCKDIASGGDWKFKIIGGGHFKLRDEANTTDFVTLRTTGMIGVFESNPTVEWHVNGEIKTRATTVAALPLAASAGAGARSFVTDATSAGFGTTVVGGGSTSVPVYSDGTSWLVG